MAVMKHPVQNGKRLQTPAHPLKRLHLETLSQQHRDQGVDEWSESASVVRSGSMDCQRAQVLSRVDELSQSLSGVDESSENTSDG